MAAESRLIAKSLFLAEEESKSLFQPEIFIASRLGCISRYPELKLLIVRRMMRIKLRSHKMVRRYAILHQHDFVPITVKPTDAHSVTNSRVSPVSDRDSINAEPRRIEWTEVRARDNRAFNHPAPIRILRIISERRLPANPALGFARMRLSGASST